MAGSEENHKDIIGKLMAKIHATRGTRVVDVGRGSVAIAATAPSLPGLPTMDPDMRSVVSTRQQTDSGFFIKLAPRNCFPHLRPGRGAVLGSSSLEQRP